MIDHTVMQLNKCLVAKAVESVQQCRPSSLATRNSHLVRKGWKMLRATFSSRRRFALKFKGRALPSFRAPISLKTRRNKRAVKIASNRGECQSLLFHSHSTYKC